jgi:hypothetical protein
MSVYSHLLDQIFIKFIRALKSVRQVRVTTTRSNVHDLTQYIAAITLVSVCRIVILLLLANAFLNALGESRGAYNGVAIAIGVYIAFEVVVIYIKILRAMQAIRIRRTFEKLELQRTRRRLEGAFTMEDLTRLAAEAKRL